MNEAQFRAMTDELPHMVWVMQADGSCSWFNHTWLAYSGLSMADSLSGGWMPLVHPDDRIRVAGEWAQASGGGQPCEIECRLRRADGACRWMLVRMVPQRDAAGQTTWLGTMTDIDELKQAAERLEKDVAMNHIAGRVARLGGWTIELPGKKLTWSDENCLIHDTPPGYKPTLDEGIGYFLPEDRATVIRLVDACAKHGTPYEFILPKMTAKGRRIWVRSLGEAVRDEAGNIIRLQGAFQDITEQKEAEARTLALEAQLATTLESITDGFCLLDRDWRFTFLNHQAERMLQRHRGDLLGKSLWEEFPALVGTPVERDYRAVVEDQRTARFETFYEPLNTWFVFHVYPTETGTAVYFQDISERRRQGEEILRLNGELEERVLLRTAQLATANKELESFAYSVSHDLRSPLNTIHGFSQLLAKIDGDHVSEKGKHYLNRIGVGVKQMGDLIEGLLTLAHLSREQLKSEAVNLSELARQIDQTHREREPQRQAETNIQEGLQANGDPRLLSSVLQNLLGNAWKFSAKKPRTCIEVGCETASDGSLVFFVKDNGAGFDMAFAHKLFGTFERLHSPGDFIGTGIGLATVKRVIERHGGRVWAEGKVGEGATFYFTLGGTVANAG